MKEKNTHSKSHYEKQFSTELARLNADQRKAVEHIEGPVMVIAGPGTGKTQIIAARIGHILKSDFQVAPHNILCLTYTDAGTVAMRNRLLQFIGPTAYRVNIYTFHAFCNDIIQHNLDYFGKREMEPISELENVQLHRSIIDSLDAKHPLKRLKGDIYYDIPRLNDLFRMMKEEDWAPEFVSQQIDKYLNNLSIRDEFLYKKANSKAEIKVGDVKKKEVDAVKEKMELLRSAAGLFPEYCEMMKALNRYDYSDMILWVLNAFKKDENFLRRYQEWYQYFLVDEFQDTSGAQNELLQLLVNFWDIPNVFVVGDDDQCIYEFQGARVKNMIAFFERYEKEIEVVILKENYRSTQNILDSAKAVIDNNEQRLVSQAPLLKKIPTLSKILISSMSPTRRSKREDFLPQSPPEGDNQPKLIQYYNIHHEEVSVVEEIERMKTGDFKLSEVAIIYAKHRQAENIISLLEKKGIPYNVKKKINVLDLTIIQQILNILTYLKEDHNKPNSGEYILFEIMHYRFFNISPRDVARISSHCGRNHIRWQEFLSQTEELGKLNLENLESVKFFKDTINRWIKEVSNLTLPLLFEKVLNWGHILKFVLDSPERTWLLQVVSTFFDFIKSECAKRPLLSLKDFLKMISQMREANISLSINKTVYEENGIHLITAHSAKGLEFQYVFMIGCTTEFWEKSRGRMNKFLLPDTLTFTTKGEENKLESARRLFYVGMTRAKEHLNISFSEKTNEGKLIERTQYVEEIISKTNLAIEKKNLSAERISEYTALALTENEIPKAQNIFMLKKEFINAMLENYSLSVTHLDKYLKCPVAFYYENILHAPSAKNEDAAFGTAIHSVMKWLFDEMVKENKFPSKESFINTFKNSLQKERSSFTDVGFKNKISLGEKYLPDYYDKYVSSWNRIVRTEFSIKNVEVDGVPINGKLDKIEFTGSNVNVVDYKTGIPEKGLKKIQAPSLKGKSTGNSSLQGRGQGGDYWRQIVFYKILLDSYKRKDWKMISGEIDFLLKDEKKEKNFIKKKIIVTKEDIAIVKEQIKTTYTKIMNHEFAQGCGEEDCIWCSFVKQNRRALPLDIRK